MLLRMRRSCVMWKVGMDLVLSVDVVLFMNVVELVISVFCFIIDFVFGCWF